MIWTHEENAMKKVILIAMAVVLSGCGPALPYPEKSFIITRKNPGAPSCQDGYCSY